MCNRVSLKDPTIHMSLQYLMKSVALFWLTVTNGPVFAPSSTNSRDGRREEEIYKGHARRRKEKGKWLTEWEMGRGCSLYMCKDIYRKSERILWTASCYDLTGRSRRRPAYYKQMHTNARMKKFLKSVQIQRRHLPTWKCLQKHNEIVLTADVRHFMAATLSGNGRLRQWHAVSHRPNALQQRVYRHFVLCIIRSH